jgi:hypothetical protein
VASDDTIDRFEPGDLVVGWHPPPGVDIPHGLTTVGPDSPGVVVRVHEVRIRDDATTQEVWILRDGREESWLASELMRLG